MRTGSLTLIEAARALVLHVEPERPDDDENHPAIANGLVDHLTEVRAVGNFVDIIEDGVFPERLHEVVEEPAGRALLVGATVGQEDLVHHACAF
jgi:hypothetical protein